MERVLREITRLPVVRFSNTLPSSVVTVSVMPLPNVVGGTTSQKVVAVAAVVPRVTGVSKVNVISSVAEESKDDQGGLRA